ncbi:MAG: Zn-dependent hydrolase [Rhodospirillaceae bacterium]|nr:Zn-dependent hydrolase [Rhodospirillaceae bacterium]
MTTNLRIDGDRLWDSLMELAEIGGTEKGGVCRLALTDLDRQGRDLFKRWAEGAGCSVSVDKMGNIFARRPGKDNSLPPVMTGSHIDTQPTGGKFDGNYGVLAGLEVVRTLNDFNVETLRPIEVVVWTNEEGSRFQPSMVASGVFAGVFDLDYGLSRADTEGKTIGEELKRIGYAGDRPVGGRKVAAFFEAHIEQGPILEAENKTIGVVEGVQGIRWYEFYVTGQEAHAGPTPMKVRKDALQGAARMITEAYRIATSRPPNACATVGVIEGFPNSINVIPGRVKFTVDLRNPDGDVLTDMGREMREVSGKIAKDLGLTLEIKEIWVNPPVKFAPELVKSVQTAVDKLGYSNRRIISGAGHDSVNISKVAPTAMIFVPCKDGISHNEIEDAKKEDIAAGCDVLLHALVEHANIV